MPRSDGRDVWLGFSWALPCRFHICKKESNKFKWICIQISCTTHKHAYAPWARSNCHLWHYNFTNYHCYNSFILVCVCVCTCLTLLLLPIKLGHKKWYQKTARSGRLPKVSDKKATGGKLKAEESAGLSKDEPSVSKSSHKPFAYISYLFSVYSFFFFLADLFPPSCAVHRNFTHTRIHIL